MNHCTCGKGMRPAAIRIINRYRTRLGLRPIAPNERDGVAFSDVLEEMAEIKQQWEQWARIGGVRWLSRGDYLPGFEASIAKSVAS